MLQKLLLTTTKPTTENTAKNADGYQGSLYINKGFKKEKKTSSDIKCNVHHWGTDEKVGLIKMDMKVIVYKIILVNLHIAKIYNTTDLLLPFL